MFLNNTVFIHCSVSLICRSLTVIVEVCYVCSVLYRDLFYQDPVLFGSQDSLDSLIDDAALVIQVPRSQLHVVFIYVCWLQIEEAQGS